MEQKIMCKSCGKKLKSMVNFCPNCGESIEQVFRFSTPEHQETDYFERIYHPGPYGTTRKKILNIIQKHYPCAYFVDGGVDYIIPNRKLASKVNRFNLHYSFAWGWGLSFFAFLIVAAFSGVTAREALIGAFGFGIIYVLLKNFAFITPKAVLKWMYLHPGGYLFMVTPETGDPTFSIYEAIVEELHLDTKLIARLSPTGNVFYKNNLDKAGWRCQTAKNGDCKEECKC